MSGLADHLVALVLEALAQVETDDGLVLGDDDANRATRSSAASGHLVEQFVLASFERTDLVDDLVAMATHGVGMTRSAAVLAIGERCLRDEGTQACVVGLVGEVRELFVGDGQIVAQHLETVADLDQATFDGGSMAGVRHGAAS